MIQNKHILYASLDLPPIDKLQALKEICSLPEEMWIWDNYRNTFMLPIMTKDGLQNKDSLYKLSDQNLPTHNYYWVKNAPPSIVSYFEKNIFNWINCKPRIVILRTSPKSVNNEHIDCQRYEFGTSQIKFRYVLQGKVSSLYFITRNSIVRPPETDLPFIMDGSWPHGMNNDTNDYKFTICLGAPWSGEEKYPKMVELITKKGISLPNKLDSFFK